MDNKQVIKFTDVEGFQHAQDGYYYRPLLFGENIFTYVAHIPPGGYMPADQQEAEAFELSLYMLRGELEVIYGSEEFTITQDTALYIPRGVAFGTRNKSDKTVSFVLSFYPPPGIKSMDDIRQRYKTRGGTIKNLAEMEEMVGDTFE
jgi:glyoxylate utilization-related uncharacterized protein